MWLSLAFVSALFLGLYDVAKKKAVAGNAVAVVLLLTTTLSTLLFSPVIISSTFGLGWFSDTMFDYGQQSLQAHAQVMLKACITLSSWMFGYVGIKHLPLTIVGPINATRPVIVLLGALLIFGERLNAMQWVGVVLALFSIFLLSRAGRREGINFVRNRYILYVALAALLGATSGLYDRYLLREIDPMFVQSWFSLYQAVIMCLIVAAMRFAGALPAFTWRWAIPLITIFLTIADMAYFVALSQDDSMVAVVSMIRRSSVVVSFVCGAVLFGEKNLRSKALDLIFILIGMVFLWLGTR
ncbi:MAG: DMT family transporter [Alistipes sp.]|nr:DMT family transporter [Alistipes sp.]MBO7343708.1 DMT family transporter [Alistipes sp.]